MKIHSNPILDANETEFTRQIFASFERLGLGPASRRVLQAWSGCGLAGFSLLEKGLCTELVLVDEIETAIEHCQATIADNGLSDRVSAVVGSVANVDGPFDVVIGNPPQYKEPFENLVARGAIAQMGQFYDPRIWSDPNWDRHEDFYANVASRLTPSGHVLVMEAWEGSRPESFESMAAAGGLILESTDLLNGFWMATSQKMFDGMDVRPVSP